MIKNKNKKRLSTHAPYASTRVCLSPLYTEHRLPGIGFIRILMAPSRASSGAPGGAAPPRPAEFNSGASAPPAGPREPPPGGAPARP